MSQPFDAVLFDLDGTLLHSAPDIVSALNVALSMHGVSELPDEAIVRCIGRGAPILVERVLAGSGRGGDSALAAAVLRDYLQQYEGRMGDRGVPFPGAAACLAALAERGLRLGVVTNKFQRFAETALRLHGLDGALDVVVGGDRLPHGKPHPEPLQFACRVLGVAVERALMVGDSINDVQAARAAGCEVVCVRHGYNEGRPPELLDCPLIASLNALLPWLDTRAGAAATAAAAS